MTALVLSLFPGIGLLDMAFEEEGFCVVRGPDLLWGGDVHRFHPPAGTFDGIVGGPPCQSFSPLRYLVAAQGNEIAPNLIPEFERCIKEAQPAWFLMENVPDAPLPEVPGYMVQAEIVNGRDHCGIEQDRTRRFCFGWRMPPLSAGTMPLPRFALEWWSPPVPMTWAPTAVASGGIPAPCLGGNGNIKRDEMGRVLRTHRKGASARGWKTKPIWESHKKQQGLPADFLDHAPFTVAGKIKAVGNGVPLPMGRTVARAVKRALAGATP